MRRAADETRDRHRAGEGQSRFHGSPSERIICRQENQGDCFEFRAVRRFPSPLAASELTRPAPASGPAARGVAPVLGLS